MITVVHVDYDNEAHEADVELLSGDVGIRCYCHPIDRLEDIQRMNHNQLIAFNVKDVMIVAKSRSPAAIKTEESYYSYNLIATVVSKNKIKLHDYIIDIGPIPNDIVNGAIISCHCMRIDIVL